MKNRSSIKTLLWGFLQGVLIIGICSTGLFAAEETRDSTFSKLPYWPGYWVEKSMSVIDVDGYPKREGLSSWTMMGLGAPYKPEVRAKLEADLPSILEFSAQVTTSVWGFPLMMQTATPLQFLITPEETQILNFYREARHVYTDGRQLPSPEDQWPLPWGDSIGRWEGDTLVIETVAVRQPGLFNIRLPVLTEKARYIERIRQVDENTLESEFTVIDPELLSENWVQHLTYVRAEGMDRMFHMDFDNDRTSFVDGSLTVLASPQEESGSSETAVESNNNQVSTQKIHDALEAAAVAMGGLEIVLSVENFQYSGFGQRYSFNGNMSPDVNAPAKWQSVVDAKVSFDLTNHRALNQERNSFQYPLAASFGHTWRIVDKELTVTEALDHPLSALRAALAEDSKLLDLNIEDGRQVVSVALASGELFSIGLDAITSLPYFVRRSSHDHTLGDVNWTTYFTGYVAHGELKLPWGIQTKMDWRDQPVYLMQVDAYQINTKLPDFPEPVTRTMEFSPVEVEVTPMSEGVWDVRVPGGIQGRGGDGGPAIEFKDHLVLFEAYGDEEQTLARIDAANKLVPGKQVTHVIITHHHSDHAGGLRAVVSRGLTVVAQVENEALYREWVSRPATISPDALSRNPQQLHFQGVDERLVLGDETRELEVMKVVGHPHMGSAVFAWLPSEKFLLEGDLSDVNWEWHWWAYALQSNVVHYDLDPTLIVPVHGEPLSLEATLDRIDEQAAAAARFCEEQADIGYRFFGCPVKYNSRGKL